MLTAIYLSKVTRRACIVSVGITSSEIVAPAVCAFAEVRMGSRGDQSWSLVVGRTFVGSSPESCHGAAVPIGCTDSRSRVTGVVTT